MHSELGPEFVHSGSQSRALDSLPGPYKAHESMKHYAWHVGEHLISKYQEPLVVLRWREDLATVLRTSVIRIPRFESQPGSYKLCALVRIIQPFCASVSLSIR